MLNLEPNFIKFTTNISTELSSTLPKYYANRTDHKDVYWYRLVKMWINESFLKWFYFYNKWNEI